MLYHLTAAYIATREALARDQGKSLPASDSLGVLVAEEIPLLSRRIGRWRVVSLSLLFFAFTLAAEIALTDLTPGPVLTSRGRVVAAMVATVVFLAGWAIVHAIRSAGWRRPTREQLAASNRAA